jgi:hypothetical protein
MAELMSGLQAQQVATSRVRTNVLARSGQTVGAPGETHSGGTNFLPPGWRAPCRTAHKVRARSP